MYKYRDGFRGNRKIPAEVVANELERIRKAKGGLSITPKTIVQESRSPSSVLHDCFEWDNEIAAELHREYQARHLVKSIVIIREEEDEPEPAYYNVVRKDVQGYAPRSIVIQHLDLFESAKNGLLANIRGAQNNLRQLIKHAPTAKKKKVQHLARAIDRAMGGAEQI